MSYDRSLIKILTSVSDLSPFSVSIKRGGENNLSLYCALRFTDKTRFFRALILSSKIHSIVFPFAPISANQKFMVLWVIPWEEMERLHFMIPYLQRTCGVLFFFHAGEIKQAREFLFLQHQTLSFYLRSGYQLLKQSVLQLPSLPIFVLKFLSLKHIYTFPFFFQSPPNFTLLSD